MRKYEIIYIVADSNKYFYLRKGTKPMALIKCNECGKEVSSKAGKCPNCGAPVEDPNLKWYQKNSKGTIGFMFIAIAFFFVCCAIAVSMW